ncbi:MAG: DMT family transporter [Acidobacteriota bacterium]
MQSSESTPATTTVRADLALGALALMWGTTFVITKEVVTTHSPFFYTSSRFGLAAIAFILLFGRHLRTARGAEIREGIILGLCVFTGITLQVAGIVYTSASKAGFITGLYLVFTPIISYLLFRVRPSRDNLAGLTLAIIGFCVLSLPKAGQSFNGGDLLVLCAAVAWATHIVATSVFGRRSDVRTLASVQVIVVAVLALAAYGVLHAVTASVADPASLPRLIAIEARENPVTWRFAAQVGYMALFATVFAALVQTWAQGKMAPTHAAILYALEPVSAAYFAYLVFSDRLGWRGGLGAAVIVAGVLVSRLGLFSRLRPPAGEADLQSENAAL